MANKRLRITELTSITYDSVSPVDTTVLTDISDKETKQISFDDVGKFVASNYTSSQSLHADFSEESRFAATSCEANTASYAKTAKYLTEEYYNIAVRQSDSSSFANYSYGVLDPNLRSAYAVSASFANVSLSSSYIIYPPTIISRSYSSSHSDFSLTSNISSLANLAISSSYSRVSDLAAYSYTASYALNAESSGGELPVGAIISLASSIIAPAGWLYCDGSIVLKQSYLDLFRAIDNEDASAYYGYSCDGDGTRNASGLYFKLPDFRGEFIRGWDNGRGVDVGRTFGSWQAAEFAAHKHETSINEYSPAFPLFGYSRLGPGWHTPLYVGSDYLNLTNFAGGAETRPRNVSVKYYIKYAKVNNASVSVSSVVAGDVSGLIASTTVDKIKTIPVASTAVSPSVNDVLIYNGSQWKNMPMACSKNTDGYTYLPNGILMQWGYQSSTNNQFLFPVPFPNICLNFTVSNADGQGAAIDNAFGYPVSNIKFYLGCKTASGSVSTYPIYWFAIGY